jgi:biotin synthase
VTEADALSLLTCTGPARERLFRAADSCRAETVGDGVRLRGLIEFSNVCRQDCLYCGLRRSNASLPRYRLEPGEIVEAAVRGAEMGLRTIVLQSGEDPWYDAGTIARIISSIKDRADVALTLSVGERDKSEYAEWKRAGASRYLLKHETSDARLFSELRPGRTLRDRLTRLEWLLDLGYEVGSGVIVGLPGQSLDSLARDVVLMREMRFHMASAGPFIPHERTPLGGSPPGSVDLALRTIAAMRLALPWANIPATTALGTLSPAARIRALRCGANVLMPNITPGAARARYEIYPRKNGDRETPEGAYRRCLDAVRSAGLEVGTGYGGCDAAREDGRESGWWKPQVFGEDGKCDGRKGLLH